MKHSQQIIALLILALLLTACGGEETTPPPTEVIIPSTPTFTPVPPTPTPIVHTMIPGEPVFLSTQLITDCTIGNGVTIGDPIILSTGCDMWDYNKIERPHDGTFKDYYPQSDISRAQIGNDDNWFFAQAFTYFGEVVDPQPMNGTYGIELDLSLEGRGDVLILASQPGEDWDVAGVRVWLDTDTTVGSFTPIIADTENPDGGYDEMIFDSGIGADSDLAWARISPENPNAVQIAFKRGLGGVKYKEQFSWIMWAGLIDFLPPEFDLVDTHTEDVLYSFDNTCSWTYGVQLQGLPNQCGIKVKEKIKGCDNNPPYPSGEFCRYKIWTWDDSNCRWVCIP